MDEPFPQSTTVGSQSTDSLTTSTQAIAAPKNQTSGNYVTWTVGVFILVLCFGGLAVAVGYKYVSANLATWLQSARERSGAGQQLPGVKKDLYGTLAGMKIVEVTPNTPAARVGLKYGDVLIAYGNRPITNDEEIKSVMAHFKEQHDQTGQPKTVELSFYRDGDMTVKKLQVPVGRLGIFTREWTFAGAFVEDAIVDRDNYAAAEKHANEAAASGQYTDDQILHMRMLCVNNEKDGDNIRQIQVDELYRKYPPEKLTSFGNYDLQHNKRFRAAVAVFERYLKIKNVDISTELNLASCYTEIAKYDEAEALVGRILARPESDENAPSEYGMFVLENVRGKIYMGRRQFDRAQARFQKALEQNPDDPYYTLTFLYCAAQREVTGEKPGEFEAAYKMIASQSHETERQMGYHVAALRALTLVKKNRIEEARSIVGRWRNSPGAKKYIPIFWRRFPDGSMIIDNWNELQMNP